jgi:serine/threonine protein phosphatase PrpC
MMTEQRGSTAVSWIKGTKHRVYEDRYRILSRDVPLVATKKRGELFAVLDGIGSAPRGMSAAQEMADCLIRFYRESDDIQSDVEGLLELLFETNRQIFDWGFIPGTDRPIGGCAGTVVWIIEDKMTVFHAGDTTALLIRDGKPHELVRAHQAPDGAIFRYFGLGDALKIDVEQFEIEESDRILLLSDGVTKVLHPFDAAIVTEENINLPQAAAGLVNRARALGATDDITVLLVQIDEIWE